MTLTKSMGRVSPKGQLGIPPHILRLAGAKPGQLAEFRIGSRGTIQVALKAKMMAGGPKPRTVPKSNR